uniref:hypothetical protein n=1 Tax=Ningiella ruwaisensis TaxID=2364274 RepID=UPI00109FED6B|nr:hypothetical protein [Ningiella ruwaisensis]
MSKVAKKEINRKEMTATKVPDSMQNASNSQTINRATDLSKAQDFSFLRKEGIAHIQRLAGHIWTDHNLHDPGITTLEALCFAINDLSYRNSFDTQSILSNKKGYLSDASSSSLFPAHEALTCAPCTALDYRQLLVRIEGVKNAWVMPHEDKSSDTKIYIDRLAQQLTFDESNAKGQINEALQLNGLLDVRLELEAIPGMGSLNENALPVQLSGAKFNSQSALIALVFSGGFSDRQSLEHETHIQSLQRQWAEKASVLADAQKADKLDDVVELQLRRIDTQSTSILCKIDGETMPELVIRFDVDEAPRVTPQHYKQVLLQPPWFLLIDYAQKQAHIQTVLERVRCAMHHHRGLCEDIASIAPIQAEYLGICSDIDVSPDADLEKLQAQICFEIEQYLNPPVQFQSLSALLEKGHRTEEIFNIPYIDKSLTCDVNEKSNTEETEANNNRAHKLFSKSGFVLNEDLSQSDLSAAVYGSDLINIIMDIPGVENVRALSMRKYSAQGLKQDIKTSETTASQARPESEKWVMPVAPQHQLLLSLDKSKFLLFKQDIPFQVRQLEFKASLAHLRNIARQQAYIPSPDSLQTPIETPVDVLSHYPLSNDFPQVYQIGEAGISEQAGIKRVNQARQFKGYLMVFEQVLADYLAQLHHLADLFSLDGNEKISNEETSGEGISSEGTSSEENASSDACNTYYSQYLKDLPGTLGRFSDEFYIDPNKMAQDSYRQSMYESQNQALARKNRLLDHLLARFSEQFSDYVMLMVNEQGDTLRTQSEILKDKKAFLRQQPVLSRQRNMGYCYLASASDSASQNTLTKSKQAALHKGLWDSENVSGLQKRLSRLAGISDMRRRDLHCKDFAKTLMDTRQTGDEFRLEIKDENNRLLFKSWELYISREAAMEDAQRLYPQVGRASAFKIAGFSRSNDDALLLESDEENSALESAETEASDESANQDGEKKFTWFIQTEDIKLRQDKVFNDRQSAQKDIDKVRARIREVKQARLDYEILFDTREYGRDHRIEIKDSQQNVLFKSKRIYETREQARNDANTLFSALHLPSAYEIVRDSGTGAVSLFIQAGELRLKHDALFDSIAQAQRAIDSIIRRYYEVLESEVCNQEGFHLIEHILLRPFSEPAALLNACIDQHMACSDDDPYSFRASIVLPYWPKRFLNIAFREFFEQLARKEAPAHIQLKICWIDDHQMREFDKAYKDFVIALSKFRSGQIAPNTFNQSQRALIDILSELKTVFPDAVLHDCDDDDDADPVRLGHTNLSL